MRTTALALSCLLGLQCACFGTTYAPKAGPGIQVTYSSLGSVVFSKDGKEVASGFFDRSLLDALAGEPEAQKSAETWRQRKLYGFAFSIIASLITLAGVASMEPGAGFNARNAFSLVSILSGSLPLSFASLLFHTSADAHLQDAINRYNDRAREKAPPISPGVKVGLTGLRVDW